MRPRPFLASMFLCVSSVAGLAFAGTTIAPQVKLHAPDGTPGDYFGSMLALKGEVLAIGAPQADNGYGAIYVFRRTGYSTWTHEQKVMPGEAGSVYDVAFDGQSIAVCSDNPTGYGSVFVFQQNALGFWEQTAKIVDGLQPWRVAIQGNWLFIGEPMYNSSQGAVYVWKHDPTSVTWDRVQTLLPSPSYGYFGRSLAISEDTTVICEGGYLQVGRCHIFRLQPGDLWSHEAVLSPSDGGTWDLFGSSLDLDANWLAVSSPGHVVAGHECGAVYLYACDAYGNWTLRTKLVPSDPAGAPGFRRIALSGNRLVVGGSDVVHPDVAYVFDRQADETWLEIGQVVAPDVAPDDGYGEVVALDGNVVVVGSPCDDDVGAQAGAAYVLDLEPSPFVAYGSGCPGTGWIVPTLSMSGDPAPGGLVQVDIALGVGSGMAFLLVGLQQAALSMGWGCTLNVAPVPPLVVGPLFLVPIGGYGPGAGSLSLPALLPPNIGTSSLTLQAFIVDPGVP